MKKKICDKGERESEWEKEGAREICNFGGIFEIIDFFFFWKNSDINWSHIVLFFISVPSCIVTFMRYKSLSDHLLENSQVWPDGVVLQN